MSNSSTVRIALLASCTIDMIERPLAAALSERGLTAEFWSPGFCQYRQALIDADSECYRFDPHVAILYLDGEDLFASLLDRPLDFNPSEREQLAGQRAAEVGELIGRLKRHLPRTSVLLNTAAVPPLNVLGSLEHNSVYSVQDAASVYNQALADITRQHPGVVILDAAALVAWLGHKNWHDSRLWHLARSRWTRQATHLLARRYAAAIAAGRGQTRKCVVLDLDNTLWGGIVGEDGVEGLRLGDEGSGLAFREFQADLRNLNRQGTLLAVCSKNNPADALQAIRSHPAMCLREEHFAAMRINWEDKASNLRSLAEELNIGLDSMIFIDDNPVERSWVREALPEVYVPDWPTDPSDYKKALLEVAAEHCIKFAITEEDRNRGEQYRLQALRRPPAVGTASLEDFYRSLEMRVTIAPATAATMPRIAQLTQKTNQFNLTTRRYSEADIAALAAADDSSVYSMELDDCFGGNGIVGVVILRRSGEACVIDTFLLSCRVMGRTAEKALLSFVADTVRRGGGRTLLGEYRPTPKNAPVAGFYRENGFRLLQDDSGDQTWELDLDHYAIPVPEWFQFSALEDNLHVGQTSA
jgi:FkbH-like protein